MMPCTWTSLKCPKCLHEWSERNVETHLPFIACPACGLMASVLVFVGRAARPAGLWPGRP